MQIWLQIASEALKVSPVKYILYLMRAYSKVGQKPSSLEMQVSNSRKLAERGAKVRACARCAAAELQAEEDGSCPDYHQG